MNRAPSLPDSRSVEEGTHPSPDRALDDQPPSRMTSLICTIIGVLCLAASLALAGPDSAPGATGEFQNRLASVAPTDVPAFVTLARWAESRGLLDEADSTYRHVLEITSNHQVALQALEKLAVRRGCPKGSESLERARELLGREFRLHETSRFVILSNADTAWTRTQAQRLERAWHQYQRFTRRLDFSTQPPRHRLVCILFRDRSDYQSFAAVQDGVSAEWISGYYSPANEWIVFYHVESNPSITRARGKLDDMRLEIAQLDDQVREARRSGRGLEVESIQNNLIRYEDHVTREQDRIDHFALQVACATTTHEAVHQLLFHTGVQTARVEYPLWICEGLACAFETDRPTQAFGPTHEYEPRRSEFRSLLKADSLMPLRRLAVMTHMSDKNSDDVHVMYHQSYALVTWMCRFRKHELREYLDAMLRQAPGRLSEPEHLEVFEAAFGDIKSLERSWLRYERGAAR